MGEMKPRATLIGDVVGSRRAAGARPALHDSLVRALEDLNARLVPVVPLRITVGDEFQGCFGTVGEACRASLLLRLALLPAHDIRHGIGWGPVQVLSDEPRVEDGPGWWAARAAIDAVKIGAEHAALRRLRTAYRRADGVGGPDPHPVDAALVLRDEIVGGLSERSVMLVRGLLQGRTQAELALELGVTASALSQRVRRDGLGALLRSDELLGKVR